MRSGDIDVPQKKKAGTETLTVDVDSLLETVSYKMGLPMHQIQMYWESFSRYDVDGSGSVDSKELKGMLIDSIGYEPTPEALKAIILECDSDGSGTLEFPEFCMLLTKMDMGEQSPDELREAFMLWSEGQEKISGDLMKRALMTYGDKMTEEEVGEFMKDADVDSDGTIDFEEFSRAMAWRTQSSTSC